MGSNRSTRVRIAVVPLSPAWPGPHGGSEHRMRRWVLGSRVGSAVLGCRQSRWAALGECVGTEVSAGGGCFGQMGKRARWAEPGEQYGGC